MLLLWADFGPLWCRVGFVGKLYGTGCPSGSWVVVVVLVGADVAPWPCLCHCGLVVLLFRRPGRISMSLRSVTVRAALPPRWGGGARPDVGRVGRG